MRIKTKHLAAILLGTVVAFGAYTYINMTDEEKKKMADSLKDKFHKVKEEAESAADTAKNYFSDLKNKATDMLKEHFPYAEQHSADFFKNNKKGAAGGNS